MMAFALYRILDAKECDDKGLDVQRLAAALHRTPDAVALKIWNIAANDANRKAAGRVGMRHGSKLDAQIWEWFAEGGDDFLFDCIDLLHDTLASSPFTAEQLATERTSAVDVLTARLGRETKAVTMRRVNQEYFRNSLMANYECACCLTGLAVPKLLVASHIKPWAVSTPVEKTAASNGLLLNALHDKAFDQGLITIDHDYRIHVAHDAVPHTDANDRMLYAYEERPIQLPRINPPSHEFIDWHRRHVWLGTVA